MTCAMRLGIHSQAGYGFYVKLTHISIAKLYSASCVERSCGNRYRKIWGEVAKASWLTILPVSNIALVSLLKLELDEGESEAITLFIEKPNQAILLDEKSARRVAKQMNLPVLGTVGILIWAKQNGLIPNLREQLDALQSVGKFRLSNLIYQEAIKKVDE
jgi:predicted nucleic acid-binding protein